MQPLHFKTNSMNILFFISHQPNPRFIKQINFLNKKHSITLVCFSRKTIASLDDSIASDVMIYNLGNIPNASQALKRIWTYISTIKITRKILKKTEFNLAIINNIDVAILYLLSNFSFFRKQTKTKLTIEISDLREFVFGKGIISRSLQVFEKYLYTNYIDKLIVTSKKYYTYHYSKFFKKDIYVLENKILSSELKHETIKKHVNPKTVIGIVGLLLRKNEYVELFKTFKDKSSVEIHIHGIGLYQEVVKEYADNYDNIKYFGPYNAFKDTYRIYNSLDYIYLVYDTEQMSLNNSLALPNKLYECMYYQVPIICSKNTYLEEIVIKLNIGIAINYKEEGAIVKAISILKEKKSTIEQSFQALDKNNYIADNDYVELEKFLNS